MPPASSVQTAMVDFRCGILRKMLVGDGAAKQMDQLCGYWCYKLTHDIRLRLVRNTLSSK